MIEVLYRGSRAELVIRALDEHPGTRARSQVETFSVPRRKSDREQAQWLIRKFAAELQDVRDPKENPASANGRS